MASLSTATPQAAGLTARSRGPPWRPWSGSPSNATTGASGKGSKWLTRTSAAGANFQEGIQRALAAKSFDKGVAAAGASSYDEGVRNKGTLNWGTGMQAGGSKYEKKVQKFASLWSQELATARGSRRSPANLKRMQENVDRFIRTAA